MCRIKQEAKQAVEKAQNAAFAQIRLAHQLGGDAPEEALSCIALLRESEDVTLREQTPSRYPDHKFQLSSYLDSFEYNVHGLCLLSKMFQNRSDMPISRLSDSYVNLLWSGIQADMKQYPWASLISLQDLEGEYHS